MQTFSRGGGGLDILTGNGGNDTLINGYSSTGGGGTDLIEITSPIVTNDLSVSLSGESIILSADLTTSSSLISGSVSLTGAVVLGSDVTITTQKTGGVAPDGNITFSSTIDSDSSARALTMIAGAGTVSVSGAIGGSAQLASLDIQSAGTLSLLGDVSAIGNITQDAGSGATTISGAITSQNGSISIATTGSISLGDQVTAGGGTTAT